MATINYNYPPLFIYKGFSYCGSALSDIPTTANADEVMVLIECERTVQEITDLIDETPITKDGLVIPKMFKKRMRLTDKRLGDFEIVNELLSLLQPKPIDTLVCGSTNDWGELELTATFQNSEFQFTITGCNSEPHLYVNVVLTATGYTYISNGRLCKGGNFQYPSSPIKMDLHYWPDHMKSICDQWITDFLNNEKNK